VELISLAEGFQFTGLAGEIAAAIFAAMAKQERVRLRQRMASARELAEKKGKTWGRPRRIDPVTLAAAKKLRDADKLSLRIIARRLKVPKATLLRALHGKGHYASKK
jgi:DNA invertase Pin-like site-specific DNA recombinase